MKKVDIDRISKIIANLTIKNMMNGSSIEKAKKQAFGRMNLCYPENNEINGYFVKGIKSFKGHEGESLVQGSVYKDGKRIGFFSEDGWSGPMQLQDFNQEDEKELRDFAQKWDKAPWPESYSSLLITIVNRVTETTWMKRQCKTKTFFKVKGDDTVRHLKVKYEGNEKRILMQLAKKYGRDNFSILSIGI